MVIRLVLGLWPKDEVTVHCGGNTVRGHCWPRGGQEVKREEKTGPQYPFKGDVTVT